MFESFQSCFTLDPGLSRPSPSAAFSTDRHGFAELFGRFGGASFNNGMYRIMTPASVQQWEALVCESFPQFSQRLSCFAYDWLGRVFAVDSRRNENDGHGVLLLEPGTGEALQIPCGIRLFHDEELVEHREEALAASFHAQWLDSGGATPARDQCIGYKRPLFLGGKDVVANLEIIDIDVYWTVSGALIRKARGLPPGTRITGIKFIE